MCVYMQMCVCIHDNVIVWRKTKVVLAKVVSRIIGDFPEYMMTCIHTINFTKLH